MGEGLGGKVDGRYSSEEGERRGVWLNNAGSADVKAA